MPVNNRIQLRRGTSTQWSNTVDILSAGELGWDTTENNVKIGDGSNLWADLPWLVVAGVSGQIINPAVISGVSGIFFDTSVGDVDQIAGQLGWNSEAGTFDVGLTDDLKISVGQSLLFRVKNSTGNTITKGEAVYASGVLGGGQVIQVAPFAADETVPEVRFIGLMLDDLANGEDGFVAEFGHIKNVDLRTTNTVLNPNAETWAIGDILFVDGASAGGLTKVQPKNDIYVALVLADGQNGELFVRITNPGHINDLHDVNTSGLVDNNLLVWNSGLDTWEPTTSLTFNGTTLHTDTDGVSAIFGRNNALTSGGKVRIYVDDNDTAGSVQAIKAYTNKTTGTNIGINATANGSGATKNIGLYGWADQATTNWGLWVDRGYSILDDRLGIKTSSPTYDLHVNGSGYINNDLHVNGDLGIGTTSPVSELDVNGTVTATSGTFDQLNVDNLRLDGNTLSSTNANGDIIIRPNGDGNVNLGVNNTVTGGISAVVGGGKSNTSSSNCSTVSGGRLNTASGCYSTIGGGASNQATNILSTVAGGASNIASGQRSVVGGGLSNRATESYSVSSGGRINCSTGPYSTTSGGWCNTSSGYGSVIGGGKSNFSCANYSTVSGGTGNTASANYSTVSGGITNNACATNSLVSGGWKNFVNARHGSINGGHYNIIQSPTNECCRHGATIGGGVGHNTSGGTVDANTGDITGTVTCCGAGRFSTIGGGLRNCATAYSSTVSGGDCNNASGSYSTVGGGFCNTASGSRSTVGGGFCNTTSFQGAAVGGGLGNTSSGQYSTVGGGCGNCASSYYSTVGGGRDNTASADYSTANGGFTNVACGTFSTVSGGYCNTSSGAYSAINGGRNNCANGFASTIGGGRTNFADQGYSTVGGGRANSACGVCSTVSGGFCNIASGNFSSISGGCCNNDAGYSNVHILGSNITATQADTTYTQNIIADGHLSASTKSFLINHPTKAGKKLQYGSLESPYHGIRLTGKDKLVEGVCVVELPDYISELVHEEDVNIQITNYKHHKTLYVDEIDIPNNTFTIKGYRCKTLGELEFFWSFTAIRKDVPDLIVEK